MGVAVLRYEPSLERRAAAARALQPVRQIGGTEVVVARRGAGTGIVEVGERGGYRVRFPDSEHGREAVLINTGGGICRPRPFASRSAATALASKASQPIP